MWLVLHVKRLSAKHWKKWSHRYNRLFVICLWYELVYNRNTTKREKNGLPFNKKNKWQAQCLESCDAPVVRVSRTPRPDRGKFSLRSCGISLSSLLFLLSFLPSFVSLSLFFPFYVFFTVLLNSPTTSDPHLCPYTFSDRCTALHQDPLNPADISETCLNGT